MIVGVVDGVDVGVGLSVGVRRRSGHNKVAVGVRVGTRPDPGVYVRVGKEVAVWRCACGTVNVGEAVEFSTIVSVGGTVSVKVVVGRGVSLTSSDAVGAAGDKVALGVVVFTGRAAGVGGAAGVQAANNNMTTKAMPARLNSPGRPAAPPGEHFISLSFLAATLNSEQRRLRLLHWMQNS